MNTVTGCDCTYCERERRERRAARHVVAAEPVRLGDILAEALPKADRAPRGLSALRKSIIDYFANPNKYMDLQDIREYDNDWKLVRVRGIEDVCGIEKLGSGAYSNVYSIDDTRVIKIVKREDSGYARFVDAVRRHPNNPHLPKIYYSGVWGGKTVYILEKLSTHPETRMDNRYGECQANSFFRAAVTQRPSENPYIRLASRYLEQAAEILREINTRGGLDLHSGNVMFRGDVPVITDPCAD